MKLLRHLKPILGSLLMVTLAACGGGGGSGSGTLRLALTDAPACGYDAVNVTIEKVRVHQSSTAADSASGWSEVVLNPARRVNLLNLQNGILEELGQTALPVGQYTQLRLVLAHNTGADPLANSVVLSSDKTEVPLDTPSAQQSGLKMNVNIDIAADQMADFVLDFDACKSVVLAGKSGRYNLKPVVSVMARYVSGVSGFVASGLANGDTSVSLQQGGLVIRATAPDSSGRFLLQPAQPGSYMLVVTAPGRSTAAVTNVLVAADTVTAVNAAGAPIDPPVSLMGTVDGTAPPDTLVRALQTLTAGPSIEIAGRFVDGVTGDYSYLLPIDAPQVAPYVAAPGTLVFAPDAAAAGHYTLSASLSGFADKTAVLAPLTAVTPITTNFTFP